MNNQNQNKNKKLNIYSIMYAHIIVSIILIYLIIIPLLNKLDIKDNTIDMFKNYYQNDKFKSLLVDFFMIYFILKISDQIPSVPMIFRRILVLILFNVLLSVYINKTPYLTGSTIFLKEWISKLGWTAIIWDLIYVNLTGKLADKINKIDIIKQPKYQLMIMGFIMIGFMHL
jgi:hypothetical protein